MISNNPPHADLKELWMKTTLQLFHGPFDVIQGACVFSYDNVLRAKTCHFDIDLTSVGLLNPAGRWTRFVDQYIESDRLARFLENCVKLDFDKSYSSRARPYRVLRPGEALHPRGPIEIRHGRQNPEVHCAQFGGEESSPCLVWYGHGARGARVVYVEVEEPRG